MQRDDDSIGITLKTRHKIRWIRRDQSDIIFQLIDISVGLVQTNIDKNLSVVGNGQIQWKVKLFSIKSRLPIDKIIFIMLLIRAEPVQQWRKRHNRMISEVDLS